MWSTIVATLIAAAVCVGLVTASVNVRRTQDALNQLPERAALMSIHRPAQSKDGFATPGMGAPRRDGSNV
jgi:hypothetical protein